MRTSDIFPRRRSGYALVVVMVSMALLLVVFASVLYWASSNATLTARNNLFNTSENAAESATENIITTMMRDFNYQTLNSASSYNTMAPPTNGWPIYYKFTDTNNNPALTASVTIGSQVWTNLNSQFAGLYGLAQTCEIASTATPQGAGYNLSATIYQSVQFALIPLFQFAVFYNMDLEASPGATMEINGSVWSNGNIWTSPGATLTYDSTVDAAGQIYYIRNPNDPQANGSSKNVVYLDSFNNPLANQDTLIMPVGGSTNNNPTNVIAIIQLPPAASAPPNYSAAYSADGQAYLMNAADLIITNAANGTNNTYGTNIIVFYQNPNNSASYLTQVPGDVLVVSNVTGSGAGKTTNLVYAYSFVTNATFYDYRESDTVQALQVNVGALNTWLASSNTGNTIGRGGSTYNSQNTSGSTSKGHQINSIYAYNNVPLTSKQLPAVRMSNGTQLPGSGLTVATSQPMYVFGNYNTQTNSGGGSSAGTTNTAYTRPAALIADAVTILSPSWSDSYATNASLSSRNASSDTVNAAMLVGIVPSATVNGTKYFSGGLENYLRLIEDWSGETLTYNGSEVAMYASQYATNRWQSPGVYYQIPTRDWGFDQNFKNYAKLPPLTPQVRGIIRGNWVAW